MTYEEKLSIFKKTGALQEGHFLLSSGLHSKVYFQCALVLQFPEYAYIFCKEIAEYFSNFEFETVISPALGGIIVGQEVARILNKRSIFTERTEGEMNLRRGFSLKEGEKVLICEDVVTTAKSSKEVLSVIEKFGAKAIGLGAIVDRTSTDIDLDFPFYATMKISAETFQPNDCPLCKQNLPIIKPGSRK
ncbi:MAG: orotate phosphoribosyltransferase [Ignavibacteria bacterium]|nr:orotate phosphoribosyltransferase [Ignavibacteria bacterium]